MFRPRPVPHAVRFGLALALAITIASMDAHATAECPAAATAPRIQGLERLYFRRIEGPTARDTTVTGSMDAPTLTSLLPETLGGGRRYWQPFVPEGTDDLTVQDFRLPASGKGREWLLREVRDTSHRLTEQWWVFYESGYRVDAWYFTPSPRLTDGKLLTDIGVVAVTRPEPDRLLVSVTGRMDRPAGAWWQMSGDLVFAVAPGAVTLQRVANRTWAYRDYERDGAPVTMSAVVERDVTKDGKRVVEVRSRERIDERQAEPCLAEPGKGAAAAQCLVASPGAEVRYRPLEEPSPIERGGR